MSTLLHETKRSSETLKDPRIRRAVSTLVYATPLHPAQRHLPVNLHPPNSAPFFGQVGWQVHAGGGHAGADSTVKMTTHEVTTRLHCWALKDTTALWAAATFMFLEMPLNATAAHILVAAATFGGPHAKSWPALPLRACVCCRVSTIVAQTCAVTSVKRAMRHRPFTTHPSPPPTLEEPRGRTYATVWADQGHS